MGKLFVARAAHVLAGFLILMASWCCVPATARATETAPSQSEGIMTDGNFRYVMNDGGGATVIGLEDDSVTTLVVPETLGGVSVTAIEDQAFQGCGFTSATLPDSVTSIGNSAFSSCRTLSDISLPASLQSIGDSAFEFCDALTHISIPIGVDVVSDSAFFSCDSLSSVDLPEGLKEIGAAAFGLCVNLSSIDLPSSLRLIEVNAFLDDSALTSIVVPEGVTEIGGYAFHGCSSLQRISLPASVTTIGFSAFDGISNASTITVQTRSQMKTLTESTFYLEPERTKVVYEEGYPLAVSSISLSQTSLTLERFDRASITATVSPAAASDAEVTWTSSDPAVATVDDRGRVYASGYGAATITAEAEGVSATCTVVVKSDNVEQVTLYGGEHEFFLSASGISGTVSWEVSDPSVLKITNHGIKVQSGSEGFGTYYFVAVEPLSLGTATLSAYVNGRVVSTLDVEVVPGGEAEIGDAKITGIESKYELVEGGVKPVPVVTLDGTKLEEGVDYVVEYRNNASTGVATLVVRGIGRYTGSKSVSFEIVERLRDVSEALVSGVDEEYELTEGGVYPEPVVTLGGRVLVRDVDYSLIFRNNYDAGTASIVIVGIGEYVGSQIVTFRIFIPESGYDDVSYDAWFFDAVMWARDESLMTGYGDGSFGPDDAISRAQLAQVLWNRAGRPETDYAGASKFVDCSPSDFYASAVAWCSSNGYMTGYDEAHFGPADVMTREQLATVLWRMEGSPVVGGDFSAFPDAGRVSEFAREAMGWAVQVGAISGQGSTGELDPLGMLTRAQTATIFMRLYA